MTVADNTSRNQYTATSGQAVFAYTFEIVNKSHIVVLKNGVTLSEGTDYTVSNVGNDGGGNVTLTSGATTGDILTLYRDMPYSRTQNYTNSGDFLASEVNADFDNLWLAGEQTDRSFSQSIRKPITDSSSISMELPEAATRANQFLKFTDTGAVTTVSTFGLDSINVRDYGATGDGSTDDTTAIQNAINEAAEQGKSVYIPAGHYKVTTLYDHYDASNNPNFPSQNAVQGRVYLRGERPVAYEQWAAVINGAPTSRYKGVILETTSVTGPLFKMGNGETPGSATATRGTMIENLTMTGECTDVLLHMNGPHSEAELNNLVLTMRGSGSSTNGNVIRVDQDSYFNRFRNLRIHGGSDSVVINTSEADVWEHIDVSSARGIGIKIAGSTNSTFSHCQVTGCSEGMELRGGTSVKFDHCWFENQEGEHDLLIAGRARDVSIDGCLFISTNLTNAHVVLGDDTGTAADDECNGINITNTAFKFVGDKNNQATYLGAIFKRNVCKRLIVDNCSFRYIFGWGIVFETGDKTPTHVSNLNWFPPDLKPSGGAAEEVPDIVKYVEWLGTYDSGTGRPQGNSSAGHMARGSRITKELTAALDMSNWSVLFNTLDADTSSAGFTITLPDFANVEEYKGQIFTIRKTSGSNTLTLSGDFESGSSVALTTAKTYVFVVGPNKFIDITT